MDFSAVSQALEAAAHPQTDEVIEDYQYVFPGAVLLVAKRGLPVFKQAVGCRSLYPEVSPISEETVFDVASLTKALVTTTLVMMAVDEDLLNIDQKLLDFYPSLNSLGKERMTVRHLLTHSSGYPDIMPLFQRILEVEQGAYLGRRAASDIAYKEICESQLKHLPGRVATYSDVGFILLGGVLEAVYGEPLDVLFTKKISSELGLDSSGFIVLEELSKRGLETADEIIAPTVECKRRGRMICGEVHDENAWALGGVAGHAGLFSTANEVQKISKELLKSFKGKSDFVSRDVIKLFWAKDASVAKSTWALGWDTPTPGKSSSGSYFSEKSVGHLAFTGCSLWIDLEKEIEVILLSNRIHPKVDNKLIRAFRPLIHDLVMKAVNAK